MRDDAAITSPRLLRKPSQMVHRHPQFADALGQGFAIFQCDRAGNLVAALLQLTGDFVQIFAARLCRQRAPSGERPLGIRDGLRQERAVDRGHLRNDLAGGGIIDREMFVSGDKFAVEIERICFHQEFLA